MPDMELVCSTIRMIGPYYRGLVAPSNGDGRGAAAGEEIFAAIIHFKNEIA